MRHVIIMAGIALISACSAGEKAKEPTQREQIGQSWKYEEAEGTKLAYVGSANSVATMTAPEPPVLRWITDWENPANAEL